jgi:DNA-binding beta-propeller fold protein YncE
VKRLFIPVGLLLFLNLVACSEQPMVMAYFPEEKDSDIQDKVWPAAPEVPRYRYAGMLEGEKNFGSDEQHQPSQGEKFFRWIVGLTKFNSQPRQLARPQNGMVGPDGRIYVTDVGNQAVYVFDERAGKLSIWENADEHSSFISPLGITIGAMNEILVADSELGRVVRLDIDGNPLGSIGADILQRPTGIGIDDDSGNLYVVDTAAHDIKVFDKTGELVNIIGQLGSSLGEFNAPTYICISDGKLYVSDTFNARVQVLTTSGEALFSIGKRGLFIGNFSRPKGITKDSDGNIYVVESYYDHILIFNAEGEYLLPIGGTGSGIGKFFLPAGIWSDTQDRIFTADMFNGRIFIMQYLGG